VEAVAAEVAVAFAVGELLRGKGGEWGGDAGRRAALERGEVRYPEMASAEPLGERRGVERGGAEPGVDRLELEVERRGDDDGPRGAGRGEARGEREQVRLGGPGGGEAGEDERRGEAPDEAVAEEVEAGGDAVGAPAEAVVAADEPRERVEREAVAGEVVLAERDGADVVVLGADGVVPPPDADDVHRADIAAVGEVTASDGRRRAALEGQGHKHGA